MVELARLNLRLGKMQETRDFLKRAIDADPENQEFRDEFDRINEINTLMNDASRYMDDTDYANAFESYRIVLEKFPLFAEAASPWLLATSIFTRGLSETFNDRLRCPNLIIFFQGL
jgi:tetratricopeptide (TPR) repeat protein